MGTGRDRRRYPRFTHNDVVRLTSLSEGGGSEDARILDASVGGVRLDTSMSPAQGSLVKVEWNDMLLLGEVLYCQKQTERNILGVELTRALYGMSELRRLNSALTGGEQTARPERVEAAA